MKNFQVRIWHGKASRMIYPSETFCWVVGLDGEVFHHLGKSIKEGESCVIMLFTGLQDVNGQDIYEGDLVSRDAGENQNGKKKRGVSTVQFKDGFFSFSIERCRIPLRRDEVKFWDLKVVGDIYMGRCKRDAP